MIWMAAVRRRLMSNRLGFAIVVCTIHTNIHFIVEEEIVVFEGVRNSKSATLPPKHIVVARFIAQQPAPQHLRITLSKTKHQFRDDQDSLLPCFC
jgi:hypothetical protein